MPFQYVEQALGRQTSSRERQQLTKFASWLTTEAADAGGVGPAEAQRIWERHIADAALFGRYWDSPPRDCVDIGSGSGLPGIVLAILWPETAMELVDRSGRRIQLIKRACRVLDLSNVVTLRADIEDVDHQFTAAVMRAVLPPDEAVPVFARLLTSGGTGVLALSRSVGGPIGEPEYDHRTLSFRRDVVEVLDPPAWMLIMSKS